MYRNRPKLGPNSIVYLAIPEEEGVALEKSPYQGPGATGLLKVAVGPDKDRDGLIDVLETQWGVGSAEYFDADEDGMSDGAEVAGMKYSVMTANGALEYVQAANTLNWANPDTDGDGLYDATEIGMRESQNLIPENSAFFVPDADPSSRTQPNSMDSDGGGICDSPSRGGECWLQRW